MSEINAAPDTAPEAAPVRVAVAFHSGYGHTARQAEAVAQGAADVAGTAVELLAVDPPRPALWASLDAADAIVFGTPTYLGGPSAAFRAFAEGSSAALRDGMRWQDKIAAGFTNSGAMSGDKLNTLVDLVVLAAQHGMIWVGLAQPAGWASGTGSVEDPNRLGSWLGAMAQSDNDTGPDLTPPATDLRTARALGRRVAAVTRAYRRGLAPAPKAAPVAGGVTGRG